MKLLRKKALRDLFGDKRRAIMSLTAIFIGIVAFGTILFSYEIINREILSVYTDTNPASATLVVDKVDDKLLELTKNFGGISAFEPKAHYELRVQTGEEDYKTLHLFASNDFSKIALNKLTNIEGELSPKDGETLIERDALGVAETSLGNKISIVLPDGSIQELHITGVVSDLSQHPASMHNVVYLYVSNDYLTKMGFLLNQIDIVTAGDKYDRESILTISNNYIHMLEQNGYTVRNLSVSDTPGISIHLEEYSTALFLIQIFSIVMLLFGSMIMGNLISSILSAQIRQIGILKAIGAKAGKVTISYLFMFFVVILCVIIVALPVSLLIAKGLSGILMGLGNMQPSSTAVSGHLYAVFCTATLIIPIIIAFFTIRRGLGITIKEALNQYGISSNNAASKMKLPNFLSRPVRLSIRNAVRRKNRFILNVAMLSVGGALFVTVATSMLFIQNTLSNNLNTLKYNYDVITSGKINAEHLKKAMQSNPDIAKFEKWGLSNGKLIYENGEIGNLYPIVAPQSSSVMIEPEMLEGRWLSNSDVNEVVISHKFFDSQPEYKIGDIITLQIGNKAVDFKLVGALKSLGQTAIYMSENGFSQLVPDESKFSSIKINLTTNGRQKTIYQNAEKSLIENGISILQSETKADIKEILSGHFTVTLQTFLFIAIMLVVVCAFGLSAAMNMQTTERTKEIGILKALGGTGKQIMQIVTAESIFISLTSWVGSLFIGIPLIFAGVYVFGNFMIETPLDVSFVPFIITYSIWLLMTFSVGLFASSAAAKRAARLSIKKCIVFE